ncbi:response regulator transcription factor [Neofamilia massiliensis]|uniref:response regulator transcription factor n=1 Tax=Neofamilia massiliensis TaxID=1673724 RepID=UPI0006BB5A2F|nr:response regulator transcription factor [Neofamilia massiliensis]
MEKPILLLEDNKIIREGIKAYLEAYAYKVETISKLSEFKNISIDKYSLFLLDINLPDGSAYNLASEIKDFDKPIIFLTVKNSDEDIIKGLNLGGDDYITKPFKPDILKARIESVLRRYKDKSNMLTFNTLLLDIDGTSLYIDQEKINISYREYQLMKIFLENIGKTISRDFLIENFWDNLGDYVNDNTLSVSINRLREKIGPYSKNLKTVRGLGYRFDYEK